MTRAVARFGCAPLYTLATHRKPLHGSELGVRSLTHARTWGAGQVVMSENGERPLRAARIMRP